MRETYPAERKNILAKEDLYPGDRGQIKNNTFIKLTHEDIKKGISIDRVYAPIERVKKGSYCTVYNHKMIWYVDIENVKPLKD